MDSRPEIVCSHEQAAQRMSWSAYLHDIVRVTLKHLITCPALQRRKVSPTQQSRFNRAAKEML